MTTVAGNPTTTKLSGAWKKTGKFGDFYSSAKISKTEILAALEKVPGDQVQLVVDIVSQKLSENSPDLNIKVKAVPAN